MSPLVLGLVLAAAVVHATWNLLLGRAPDIEAATAVAVVAGLVLFTPVAVSTWERTDAAVTHRAVPFLVASALFELGYFALLARSYGTGRPSAVYPVARGSAPVLVLAASLLTGQAISAAAVGGVLAIAAGVVVLRLTPGLTRTGLVLGIATGCCVAGYTLVDFHGLRYADPLPYLELAMTVPALGCVALVARRKGWPALRDAVSAPTVLAGVGVFGAYSLALAALAHGAAAPVAAVRETGIVILTVLSAVFGHEPVSRRQWLGVLVVTSGVMTIALG